MVPGDRKFRSPIGSFCHTRARYFVLSSSGRRTERERPSRSFRAHREYDPVAGMLHVDADLGTRSALVPVIDGNDTTRSCKGYPDPPAGPIARTTPWNAKSRSAS